MNMDQDPTQPPNETEPPSLDGPGPVRLDTAEQSLADALRVCFLLLKVTMVVVLIVYLFSGVFLVPEQSKKVRLRFGGVVGSTGEQVLEPGGPYFALPYPLEEVVTIPTAPQQIDLITPFWYELAEGDIGQTQAQLQRKAGPLNPEKDGSLLTGDSNIVHGRWSVTYVVDNPIDFVTRVGDTDTARELVSAAAESAIVTAVAGMTGDVLIKTRHTHAARLAQQALDDAGTGITITQLIVRDAVYPLSVRRSVQAVLDAESIRARLREEADTYRTQTLVGTAGEAYAALVRLIERYELASQLGDPKGLLQLETLMDQAFFGLEIASDTGTPTKIGGQVAELIHDAQTYRVQTVAQVRGEADYFNNLLVQYRLNPRIVLNRLWEDTRQEVLTGDIETVYLPPGQTYLDLNRDPAVRLERERRRLTEQNEATQPGQGR